MNLCHGITYLLPVAGILSGILAARLGATLPLSLGIAVGVIVGPPALLSLAVALREAWAPEVPPCHCGNSASLVTDTGYEFIESARAEGEGEPQWVFVRRCRHCENTYVQRGDHFLHRTRDGVELPYMTRVKGRWRRAGQATS